MPDSRQSYINNLPEELQLLIVSFLDSEPPSVRQFWSEPTYKLCSDENGSSPIKNLSLVSRSWRRIALPTLLSSLRIHLDLGRARLRQANGRENAYEQCLQQAVTFATDLIRLSSRKEKVYSITIIADSIINDGLNENGEPVCVTDSMRLSFQSFLETFFAQFNPEVFNIVAAPLDMGLFIGAHFGVVVAPLLVPSELGLLYLRCDSSDQAGPDDKSEFYPGSVFKMRNWSEMGFNISCIQLQDNGSWTERSSLIGSALLKHLYERYQEPDAAKPLAQPTVLKKLLICVNRCPRLLQYIHEVISLVERLELADTDIVSYTASDGWIAVEAPQSSSHVHFTYERLVRMLQGRRTIIAGPNGQEEYHWKVSSELMHLKEVVIHDVHSPSAAQIIDHIFTGLHLPVWAEYERGVYTRLLKLPADG